MTRNNEDGKSPSKSFITGAVALAFLLIGYQTAVFIHRAATLKILSSSPDTVYVTPDLRQARIAYIPVERYVSEEGALSSLIYTMKELTTENGRTYLETLGAMLECSNLRLRKVIGFIEELKEEIKVCGIE